MIDFNKLCQTLKSLCDQVGYDTILGALHHNINTDLILAEKSEPIISIGETEDEKHAFIVRRRSALDKLNQAAELLSY